MGIIVGIVYPEEPGKGSKGDNGFSFDEHPLADKYKGMKTAELEALLAERGIEAPEKANNLKRIELLTLADEAEDTPEGKADEAEAE